MAGLAADVRAHATPRVKVRGTTSLSALAFPRSPHEQLVQGTLLDDTGRGAAGRTVRVTATAGARVVLERCPSGGAVERLAEGGVAARTDESGAFCVRLAARDDGAPLPATRLRLAHEGDAWLDGASIEQLVDASTQTLALRFVLDGSPARIALDDPAVTVRVVAEAPRAGGDPPTLGGVEGVIVALSDERGESLGDATTGPGGLAVFSIATARLGPPGAGELRARTTSGVGAAAAPQTATVERIARVHLEADAPADAVVRDESVELEVAVRALGAAVPRGSVVARVGAEVVAASPVDGGRAHLVVPGAETGDVLALALTFVPDAPGFVPDAPLALRVRLRDPSPLRHAPWVLAALGVAAFFVFGRRRPVPGDAAAPRRDVPPRRAEARLEVLAEGPPAAPGTLQGRVVDAHDGRALGGARVRLERSGFDGVVRVAEAQATDDGSFVLPASGRAGDELVGEATYHRTLRAPAPSAGFAQLALAERRRALVDDLVAWATARAPALARRSPEPTPADVRAAAGDPDVARWASAVERLAFGAAPVDASAERAAQALSPAGDPGSSAEDDVPRARG